MTAYAYIRVSTDAQVKHGHSLDGQLTRLNAYAAFKGLPQPTVFVDEGVSAAGLLLRERPQGKALLDSLTAGDHVLFTDLDRAWRRAADALVIAERWRDTGVTLHILSMGVDTSTPIGMCFFQMAAAFAQLEGALLSERTSIGLAAAKAKGIHVGVAPMGFRHDQTGRLRPHLPELLCAAALLAMRRGAVPMEARLLALRAAGFVVSRTGRPWSYERVRQMTKGVARPAHAARIAEALESLHFDVSPCLDSLGHLVIRSNLARERVLPPYDTLG